MSIVKYRGRFIPTCNICGAELEAEDEWDDAVYAQKKAGWKSNQHKGEWETWCDTCLEKAKAKFNPEVIDLNG